MAVGGIPHTARRAVRVGLVCMALVVGTVAADGAVSRANAATTPVVNAGDVTVSEGNVGVENVVVPIQLSQPASTPVSVKWVLQGVTATAGSDFKAAHGTATFKARITNHTITVHVYGDTVPESDETFSVVLSAPVGATIGRNGTVTIRDDDSARSSARANAFVNTAELAVGSASVVQGNAGKDYIYIPVTLSQPPSSPVSVTVATECGSAASGVDYVATGAKKLLFTSRQRSKELTFQILNGSSADATYFLERVALTAGGASVQVSTGSAVILGNAASASLSARGSNARAHVADAAITSIQRASVARNGSELVFNDNGCGGNYNAVGSKYPLVSDDGTKVVFYSDAINVVPGVTDGKLHVYLRDLSAGTTEQIDSAPGISNGFGALGMSADGRYVTYGNDKPDRIYRYDRVTHTTIGVSALPSGTWAANPGEATISADGSTVAFLDNGLNQNANLYVRNVATGKTRFVAKADTSFAPPALSGDGRYVGFETSDALISSDTNNYPDVYVADLTAGSLERANITSSGAQEAPNSIWPTQNPTSFAISRDGRYVAFTSWSSTFTTHVSDIIVRDRVAGTTTSVTGGFAPPVPSGGTCSMRNPSLSNGAALVVYSVRCENASGTGADLAGVFVTNTATGVTTRVDTAADGTPSNADPTYGSEPPQITPDGSVVAFDSIGSNLVAGDTNGEFDCFVATL
jgi:hypothetical protein